MGKCIGSCASTDAAQVQFFKVNEASYDPSTMGWYQKNLCEFKSFMLLDCRLTIPFAVGSKDATFSFVLPKGIPSGDYIMRHEMISLQNAGSVNGAEFFPACIRTSQMPISQFMDLRQLNN